MSPGDGTGPRPWLVQYPAGITAEIDTRKFASLKDVLATTYHLLGVDPQTHVNDREGRPVALVPDGKVMTLV